MDESIITFNFPNLVTVALMGGIAYFALVAISKAVKARQAS